MRGVSPWIAGTQKSDDQAVGKPQEERERSEKEKAPGTPSLRRSTGPRQNDQRRITPLVQAFSYGFSDGEDHEYLEFLAK